MNIIGLQVNIRDNFIVINYKPIIGITKEYKIEKLRDNMQFFHSGTATLDMRDFIGNISKNNDDQIYEINGVYRGIFRKGLKARSLENRKLIISERVMITEHLNVNGQFELVISKKRILDGNLNFINIGWSDEKECDYLRIDYYTGEARVIKGDPVFGGK
jgi:hypothetical protein